MALPSHVSRLTSHLLRLTSVRPRDQRPRPPQHPDPHRDGKQGVEPEVKAPVVDGQGADGPPHPVDDQPEPDGPHHDSEPFSGTHRSPLCGIWLSCRALGYHAQPLPSPSCAPGGLTFVTRTQGEDLYSVRNIPFWEDGICGHDCAEQ